MKGEPVLDSLCVLSLFWHRTWYLPVAMAEVYTPSKNILPKEVVLSIVVTLEKLGAGLLKMDSFRGMSHVFKKSDSA